MKTFKIIGISASAFLSITTAQAATVLIDGVGYGVEGTGPFIGYGTPSNKNNVVNHPASHLTDANADAAEWRVESSTTQGVVKTGADIPANGTYSIDWYFVGGETAYEITFRAPGIIDYPENDENNNCPGCATGGGDPGVITMIGTSTGLTATVIPFEFWRTDGANNSLLVSNAANNPEGGGSTLASIMYSYVTDLRDTNNILTGWVLSALPTNWFAFGVDDGGVDDDHDDWMGVANVRFLAPGQQSSDVPLPAALPLLGSGLAAMGFVSWRKRRKALA